MSMMPTATLTMMALLMALCFGLQPDNQVDAKPDYFAVDVCKDGECKGS